MATFKNKVRKAAERGLDRADRFADEAIDSARRGKRRLEASYDDSDIGGRIEEFAEDTGRKLRNAYDASADTIDETTTATRDLVQRNPLLAIAGAFVGGLVASALLRK